MTNVTHTLIHPLALSDVAETWIPGWTPTIWGVWIALLALSIAGPFILASVTGLTASRAGGGERPSNLAMGIFIVGTIIALVGMGTIPSMMMRHFEHHESAGLLAIGTAIVAIVLAIVGWRWARTSWGALLGFPLGWSAVVGFLNDSLNRGAASVPMNEGAFLLLLVALVVGGVLYYRRA